MPAITLMTKQAEENKKAGSQKNAPLLPAYLMHLFD
jgi:hypothetical protein